MKFRFPQMPAQPLQKLVPTASPEAINLMTAMCQWDPRQRPTAQQVGHASASCAHFLATSNLL